ncbi:EF-hand domain-containing protein [Uliginosibacterium sediminicola]|uniref:EF-hand domain-containing protein n=1 Tax=Uliginosibacterium sediminicola TaxID=2024550 RepID=A0ABU9Z322_9RHOO
MKTTHTLVSASLLALFASTAALAQQSAPASDAPVRHRVEIRIKDADTDKDGFISRAEAEKGLPQLFAHFDEVDTNKDGKISASELKAMARRMPPRKEPGPQSMPRMHAMHMMHGMPGGPGMYGIGQVITREELVQRNLRMLQDFDEADTDKDGKLSREEVRAWHEKMRSELPRPPQGGELPPPPRK